MLRVALVAALLSLVVPATAQTPGGALRADVAGASAAALGSPATELSAYRTVRLDRPQMATRLAVSPQEALPGDGVALPLPGGGFAEVRVGEASVMAPELQAQFPEIRTYLAQGDGFSLLGNPFGTSLDVSNIGSWTGASSLRSTVVQVWKANGSTYENSVIRPTVSPWQGFWAQGAAVGTLTIPASARSTGGVLSRPAAADALVVGPRGVTAGEAGAEGAFALDAPRSNPSRGVSVVGYGLAEAGSVRLSVFDLLGREVSVVASGD